MLSIFCPTYERSSTLQPLVDSIRTRTKLPYILYFGIEPEDTQSIEAANKTDAIVIINAYSEGYSNTIQTMYEQDASEFFVHINDDFEFLDDWDEAPLSMFETPSVMVVGMKQAEGDTHGSAISMIRRRYIEEQSGVVDMANRVFFPYHHCYQDTEFTQTAQHRGVWALCGPRGIKHRHPGLPDPLPTDETYQKNEKWVETDKATYESRIHLWS